MSLSEKEIRTQTNTQRDDGRRTQGESRQAAVVFEPRREDPGETSPAHPWPSGVWPPEPSENYFLLLKLPGLGSLVAAAGADRSLRPRQHPQSAGRRWDGAGNSEQSREERPEGLCRRARRGSHSSHYEGAGSVRKVDFCGMAWAGKPSCGPRPDLAPAVPPAHTRAPHPLPSYPPE